MMQNQSATIRLMAQKYLQLAKTTDNPQERTRFLSYAAFYADLSEQRQTTAALSGNDRERKEAH